MHTTGTIVPWQLKEHPGLSAELGFQANLIPPFPKSLISIKKMSLLKTRASFLPFTQLSHAATMSTVRNPFVPKTITIPYQGEHIAGHLYLPENYDPTRRYPAVAVGGALSTVKEMMAGTYAGALSRRGVIGLALDYRNYGQSGGFLRQREDAESKVEDLSAAAAFLTRRGGMSSNRRPTIRVLKL